MTRELPALDRRRIEAIKEAVPVERYAEDVGAELYPAGQSLRGRCPIHGGESTDALSVDPEQRLWYCHRCGEGGDVLTLCQRVEGGETWEAMVSLSLRYGVELPERPRSWHRKQERQMPVREQIRAARVEVLRRRLFRMIMIPLIECTTHDDASYRHEVEEAWRDFQRVPVEMLVDRCDQLGGV